MLTKTKAELLAECKRRRAEIMADMEERRAARERGDVIYTDPTFTPRSGIPFGTPAPRSTYPNGQVAPRLTEPNCSVELPRSTGSNDPVELPASTSFRTDYQLQRLIDQRVALHIAQYERDTAVPSHNHLVANHNDLAAHLMSELDDAAEIIAKLQDDIEELAKMKAELDRLRAEVALAQGGQRSTVAKLSRPDAA